MKDVRFFLIRLMLILGIVSTANAAPTSRIITTDWAIAETLAAMGTPPVGVGDLRSYRSWVIEPALPSDTVDVGLRTQPNLELIKSLRPDLVINASWLPPLPARFLQNNTQVHPIDFYNDQGISWLNTLLNTRKLGQLVNQTTAADQLIVSAVDQFAQQKQALASYSSRPFAVVQFIDARHLRIYGRNSLMDITLTQLGLQNAWQGETNTWGFNNIDIIELAKLPSHSMLVVIQPHPLNVPLQLEKSILWQRLPFSQPSNQVVLPPVWSFGALPSMQRFAQTLTDALTYKQVTAW